MDKSEYFFINRSGSQVKTEEEASGHHIKHRLSHTQYVMFEYEVGTDTKQMDDGNNGGRSYISKNVMRTNLLSSKASGHFTFMGLTDATGDPLLCICILASQSLIVTYVKVFDYCASIPYDSSKTTE